jgi:hypothetical protein
MSEFFAERAVEPGLGPFPIFGAVIQPLHGKFKHTSQYLRLGAALFIWAAAGWLLIATPSSSRDHAHATQSDSVLCKRH